jgi:hypothetical protein
MNYKKLVIWLIVVLIVGGFSFWLVYNYNVKKSLKVISPNGGELVKANEKYKIKWKSKKVSRVGIVLVKGLSSNMADVKWIAKDIPASKGEYEWNVFVWEEPGENYRIAVFEYPWEEGKLIDYSDDFFSVLGPQFASCDQLSIEAEWPFIPSDFPNIKKVFITSKRFNGDLGRLQGADEKCQNEAKERGYEGNWKAFLGDDVDFATQRLDLNGIFVMAEPSGNIPQGKTCHRLLGKSFDDFFKKISDPVNLNIGKFGDDFIKNLGNIWLGRINQESKRECIEVPPEYVSSKDLRMMYSFTSTCQNWTTGKSKISENVQETNNNENVQETNNDELEGLPICFTSQGGRIFAMRIGGLSSQIVKINDVDKINLYSGEICSEEKSLLCIQQ